MLLQMSALRMDCKNLINKTVEKYGTIDILVNNAGLSMRASFIDVDLKVLHTFNGCKFLGNCLLYKICFAISYQNAKVPL